MKVCMIVPNPAVKGGIASVVDGYKGSVLERRYQVSYVESYCNGSKRQKLRKAVSGYFGFVMQLLFNKPDIVHIHSSFGPSFYRKMPFILLSRLCRIPVVNHIHGAEFDIFYEQASWAKKRLIGAVYNKCSRLLVLSEEWKDRIGRFVPAERIVVVENYCVIPGIPYDRGRDARQVLFVGELGERKGCYDIPKIWERVIKEVPSARLVMAGDGETEQVKQGFAQRGLLSRVSFPGWVRGEDKARLFEQSAVFLFPTYNEGMPMAVLEAMSYGMGIVTTAVGGIPKLIRDGENGRILRPGETEAIAQAVTEFLVDPAGRDACGQNARKSAAHCYGLDRHLEKLGEVYEAVAKEAVGVQGSNMGKWRRALGSAVRIVYWRCRYGRRFMAPCVQGFDRLHLEIAPQAKIRLGERIQNRGALYLVCGQTGKMQVGSHVYFNTNCSVSCMGEIQIGDYCKIGNNTVIVDHDHNYRNQDSEYLVGSIFIGSRVWIGANCTILRGAHIGDGCVIAAGSIVKTDVPAGSMFCQKRQTTVRSFKGGR